ncbi:tyrosine--tRNA ligase [Paenibacillus sp. FSL M8-0228]|jgi:tyrosyl-tRNA synthetase|uniref:Tyrosine--tRNA ligase n=1 Tax=Paenibacillus polymyxa TaxID=1406 RepID=A0AAP4E9K9_PAEPO|nr:MULTISPECIES: tyrosine--tRNA ligase [Paenibacillus]ADM70775.1 tyrosyl-tRNA synthetase [Paenibacillus polymyxa E681]ALA42929.1 tyrosyl-tRNA synthetase [Paenibacillus peoriae]APQ60191.1 tyrosyl-tRNA synthetase [Paenibacillus polymyxa]KEO79179.1 tyrosyl-tRNA synthetase [Paenibacillus polymyxa]MBO3286549.1 tyrosine--tRNA ligase [Paenibacillus polymyxa]
MKWEELKPEQQVEVERQLEVIQRGVAEIVPEDELKRKVIKSVVSGEPLKIKLGLDPSAPDIHIGHTVVMHKLRQFQELGHQVQLIIGDFTGRIGDPTGKSETRKQLTEEDVQRNAQTYKEQIFKILDPEKTKVFYNSEWLGPMSFADVVTLSAKVTVARMLERDDFTKRYQNGLPISIHEFFYPLMQGMDSVALQSDIELGGTDQKFNLLMGRTLQKEYGVEPQATITLPLLEGLDGVQKMSKSLGNYIGVDEEPNEIYGKSMSVPDELMLKYFELATDINNEELAELAKGVKDGSVHPRDAKMKLAGTLVRMYHGEEAEEAAKQHFVTVFQQRALPDDIEEFTLTADQLEEGGIRVIQLLTHLGFAASNGEAKRSIQQGSVKINEEKWTDVNEAYTPKEGDIVQVGKRKFAKIKLG